MIKNIVEVKNMLKMKIDYIFGRGVKVLVENGKL